MGSHRRVTTPPNAFRQLRPVFRPDKGTPLRVGRLPTLIHNVETLAHIALIERYGSEPFRARGSTEQPGTSLVTISGAVFHPGVVEVEVEWGIPLSDIVQRAEPFETPSALLVGGYGGSWIRPTRFATPYSRPRSVPSARTPEWV
jgi:NADH:ubiquinone oxidoreductase subunit F (NADH-binding)